MSLDKAIIHGKEKENHTEVQRQLTALVEITARVLGAEITGFISLAKLCTYGKNSNRLINLY